MKTDLFQSCGHCWVFHICWHIECSTCIASSFRIWSSSTGIPSPPLALFVVMLPKAHLTSYSRMSGSRWVITPSWLSVLWRSFLYSSSLYSRHLFLISSASLRSIPFLSFIEPTFAWNVPLVSLIFLKRSLVFPILLFSSISLHWLLRKAFLSLLAVLWNSAFKWVCLFFSPLLFASLLFTPIFLSYWYFIIDTLINFIDCIDTLLLTTVHTLLRFHYFPLISLFYPGIPSRTLYHLQLPGLFRIFGLGQVLRLPLFLMTLTVFSTGHVVWRLSLLWVLSAVSRDWTGGGHMFRGRRPQKWSALFLTLLPVKQGFVLSAW